MDTVVVRVMILAQKAGARCSSRQAFVGAQFLPGQGAREVWAWLQDPVLTTSDTRPPDWPPSVEEEFIELRVPASWSSGLLGTTMELPSGACIKVQLPEGCSAGDMVTICVPRETTMDQGEVKAVDLSARAEALHQSVSETMPTANTHCGQLGPMTLEQLEEEAPIIAAADIPSSLRGGNQICICCQEPLESGDLCLRQLPCSHAFHSRCIDSWLTGQERSCPTCRVILGSSAPDEEEEQPRLGAYEEFQRRRASGLDEEIRQHQLETAAALNRMEQQERQRDQDMRAAAHVVVF